MLHIAQKEEVMTSIAIYNNKGGVGKTTSVINISQQLAEMGKQVLVADTDGQENCRRFFSGAVTERPYGTRYERIDMIAAVNDPDDIFSFSERQSYDYVLIDMPPALNDFTRSILTLSDYVFVPIELGLFSVQGVPTVTDIISRSGTRFGGCFANRFDRDNPSDVQLLEMLRSNLGKKAMDSVIPYSRVIKNSINFSVTAAEYMGWTSASAAFAALTREIIERTGG